MHNPRLPEVNVGEMASDDDSDSGLCALERCNRARHYWDRCCRRCFATEGEEHDQCCDRRACDNGQRSLAETEDSMPAAEEDGPTAATRPAAAEEGDRTAAAASAASQENDVCSYRQYRRRKLKHTQDS